MPKPTLTASTTVHWQHSYSASKSRVLSFHHLLQVIHQWVPSAIRWTLKYILKLTLFHDLQCHAPNSNACYLWHEWLPQPPLRSSCFCSCCLQSICHDILRFIVRVTQITSLHCSKPFKSLQLFKNDRKPFFLYSRLTLLWWFQEHSKETQPYIYRHPFSP